MEQKALIFDKQHINKNKKPISIDKVEIKKIVLSLVHDKELLKKYSEIWDMISNLLKIGFDSEPVYDNN